MLDSIKCIDSFINCLKDEIESRDSKLNYDPFFDKKLTDALYKVKTIICEKKESLPLKDFIAKNAFEAKGKKKPTGLNCALNGILNNKKDHIFIIQGILGSGKTTLIRKVAERIREESNRNNSVCIISRSIESDILSVHNLCLQFLENKDLKYDYILVDNANLINIPYLFVVAACASEKLVLCGDYMQTGPISRKKKELRKNIYDYYGGVDCTGTVLKEDCHFSYILPVFFKDRSLSEMLLSSFYIGLKDICKQIQIDKAEDKKLKFHLFDYSLVNKLPTSSIEENKTSACIISKIVKEYALTSGRTCTVMTKHKKQCSILSKCLRPYKVGISQFDKKKDEDREPDVLIIELPYSGLFVDSLIKKGCFRSDSTDLLSSLSFAKDTVIFVADCNYYMNCGYKNSVAELIYNILDVAEIHILNNENFPVERDAKY